MNKEIIETIVDATLKVMQEKTFSGVRMKLIAEEAGIVPSNIHYYFPTKTDLMNHVQKELENRMLSRRWEILSEEEAPISFREKIWGLLHGKCEQLRNSPEWDYAEIDFWVQGRINPTIAENFRESFRVWREDFMKIVSQEYPDMPEEKLHMISTVYISMCEGIAIQYLMEPAAFDLKKYFLECEEIILKMAE